jgi:hypothetical protein
MTDSPRVDPGTPIQTLRNGAPILYGTLGAMFHLEILTSKDEPRLEAACDVIWRMLGADLRSSSFSFADRSEPAKRSHLDYISSYPSHLALTPSASSAPEKQLVAEGRDDYDVTLTGAPTRATASPFGVRFWAEIGDAAGADDLLPAYSTLSVSVPEAWPLDDFRARVIELAGCLPLRWGAAGYAYSGFIASAPTQMEEARYPHARRHPGYDVGEDIRMMERFHAEIRTVNWLTWVGPALLEKLAAKGVTLASSGQVSVTRAGDSMLLQAGPRPERGDVNRLDIPAAYREADALVRPVRASDPHDLFFGGFPGEAGVEEWLRRFEKRVV